MTLATCLPNGVHFSLERDDGFGPARSALARFDKEGSLWFASRHTESSDPVVANFAARRGRGWQKDVLAQRYAAVEGLRSITRWAKISAKAAREPNVPDRCSLGPMPWAPSHFGLKPLAWPYSPVVPKSSSQRRAVDIFPTIDSPRLA